MFRKSSIAGATLLGCWVCAQRASADQLGPAPVFSTTIRGNFVAFQEATRVFEGSQTDNFLIEMTWPGTVVVAYANWSYLTDFPGHPDEAGITINGTSVVGSLSATTTFDTDWGYAHVASYTADVTGLLSAGGPGSYQIGSAVDNASTFALGEGITILIVFDDGEILRHVHVYLGGINTSAGSLGVAGSMGLMPPFGGGELKFFVNALDGQDTLDEEFRINGVSVGGLITGGSGTNAFVGAEGPPGNPGEVRYDRAQGDISGWSSVGQTLVVFETIGPFSNPDAVGHTIGAISYVADCFGDLNRDLAVDVGDLAVLLANFGSGSSTYTTGDLNNDHVTSIADLASMLGIFGSPCP